MKTVMTFLASKIHTQEKSGAHAAALIAVIVLHLYITYVILDRKSEFPLEIKGSPAILLKFISTTQPSSPGNKFSSSKINNIKNKSISTKSRKSTVVNEGSSASANAVQTSPQFLLVREFSEVNPPALTIIEQAKRDISKIDRDIRRETPRVSAEMSETRFSRLAKGFEQAYVGSNSNDMRAYYESPEGIFYFMEIVRGQKKCSMSAASVLPSSINRGPTEIKCPNSGSWKRY